MAEVNSKFQEIAEQLSKSNYIQTINLKMPGVANGTRVRFTFDNVKDAANSTLYIEGRFNLKNKSLDDISYVGLTSTSGSSVQGKVEDIFVNFTFEGVKNERNVLIKSEFTDEWTYVASNSTWQINSEFDKSENSEVQTERSSAAIMLVLDCSSSLGEQFSTAQANAKGFIKTLFEASGMSVDSENPDEPGKNEPTIYSTTPTDLSVAIWKDNTRYFLTHSEYKNANLSGATVEGLCVVARTGNFIISPYLLVGNYVWAVSANTHFTDVLPDEKQATVISARYIDINNALSKIGWTAFGTDGAYYLTKTKVEDYGNNTYVIDLYNHKGGDLGAEYGGYLRGVSAITEDKPIIWSDPNDLKLAVKRDGVRYYLDDRNCDMTQYDEVEGVAVITGSQKFIVKLNDEQSGYTNVTTALSLYEDLLPTFEQAVVISMRYSDINNALRKFGGDPFSTSGSYYLTKPSEGDTDVPTISLYSYSGGMLDRSSIGYIRGVITIED